MNDEDTTLSTAMRNAERPQIPTQAEVDNAARNERNRLSGRAWVVNAWLHQLRTKRGANFIIGPSDLQSLEQMERWAAEVPVNDPAT